MEAAERAVAAATAPLLRSGLSSEDRQILSGLCWVLALDDTDRGMLAYAFGPLLIGESNRANGGGSSVDFDSAQTLESARRANEVVRIWIDHHAETFS